MALEVVYEGMIAGTKKVSVDELQSTGAVMEPGRICCLTAGGSGDANTVYVGDASGTALDPLQDCPFGLVADYKDDVIASGKISAYFTPGLYLTDQISSASASIVKGTLLSFDTDGTLIEASTGEFVVGICIEPAGDDGFMEIKLEITGLQSA